MDEPELEKYANPYGLYEPAWDPEYCERMAAHHSAMSVEEAHDRFVSLAGIAAGLLAEVEALTVDRKAIIGLDKAARAALNAKKTAYDRAIAASDVAERHFRLIEKHWATNPHAYSLTRAYLHGNAIKAAETVYQIETNNLNATIKANLQTCLECHEAIASERAQPTPNIELIETKQQLLEQLARERRAGGEEILRLAGEYADWLKSLPVE